MTIKQLPIELANQIAAGEVVERPASVVKELVENALDAGADELTIDIENGGIKRIRIRDNGCGIAKAELALALTRHATSKISTLEDLEAINSLGFRGEALASISSVSRLRLTSKPAAQPEAWQAWTEGRDMAVRVEPAAHPDGTSIDIQDIFFNTPARRKFLRTEKTEFTHIDEIVKRIALSRFDIAITLNHQGKRVRYYPHLKGLDEAQQRTRVARVCGSTFAEHALYITREAAPFKVKGWIATPEQCRHQGDIQYCFVNGRMMRDKLLNHAIRQAYERYLLPERVPTYVLYFWLPAKQVDVNVHPAKHEVRFHQQRQVHDFILQAVQEALKSQHDAGEAEPEQPFTPSFNPVVGASSNQPSHHYRQASGKLSESLAGYRAGASILPNAVSIDKAETKEVSTAASHWRALTVMQARWLLMRSDDDVAWLDLNAVQQQVMAKQLTKQLSQGLSGQPLLVEVSCDLKQFGLSAAEVLQQQARLNQCGMNFQLQGSRLLIDTMPSMLRQGNVAHHAMSLVRQVLTQPSLTALGHWLAGKALQSDYSLVQAEHWLHQWQQQLQQDARMRYTVQPPQPESE